MKRTVMPPLSIIVPTLNEADNLLLLFERIHRTLRAAGIPFEIIVVDDHSNDATAAIARSAAGAYKVRLVMKQGKLGKAYSLQQGFREAQYDLVCMIDADLQYPPEAINRMYHKLLFCDADIVITNRVDQRTGPLRRLCSKLFHVLFTRALFGIDYDTQSGLKLFKKRVLRDLHITASPWTFDLEFIVRSLEKKYVILSENITFAERYAGVPKINILSATFELAWQSLKLRRKVAARRVKLQYRTLQPLQQSFNWIAALVIGFLVVLGVSTTQASALSLRPLGVFSSLKASPPVATTATLVSPPPVAKLAVATPPTYSDSSQPAASGQNTPYYPPSKLSTSKTDRWRSLALRVLEVGIGLITVALLLLGGKIIVRKLERARLRQTLSENR